MIRSTDNTFSTLSSLAGSIHSCQQCPRLRDHCLNIARIKKRSHLTEHYWGKPISGFGDPSARLIIVGLAPAAHGANRTGRIFTGDRSGEWLYRALHRAGFANQSTSINREDGLALNDAYVTCIVKCAPPENKPLPDEQKNCSGFLAQEIKLLKQAKVWIALGQIGLNGLWPLLQPGKPRPPFGHGTVIQLDSTSRSGNWLLLSYHPSQQNTFTKRLTEPMFDSVFAMARKTLTSRPGTIS